ncbi:MAG: extracellular solute-binding protein [Bacilli bacterium]
MKKWIALASTFVLATSVVAACGKQDEETKSPEVKDTEELVIYTTRKEEFLKPLTDRFAKEKGITVKLLSGDDTYVNRLVEEKINPQADVFVSTDAGSMEYLRIEEVLQGNDSETLARIDEKFRAEDGSWVGLTARTRGFIYNPKLITEEEMPKNLEQLSDEKYKGKFAITRGGNGSMIAHTAALRKVWGDDVTKEWLSAIAKNNGGIYKGHGDIRKAVGNGEIAFGLVNNYYFHQQLGESAPANEVGFIYPDQEGIGAFVNASGVALINKAPNEKNARAFIEWMLQSDILKEYAALSLEVPLDPTVPATEIAAPIDSYKVMDINLRDVGPVWNTTKKLIEEAGLPYEVQ